jgi:hypothetical protein
LWLLLNKEVLAFDVSVEVGQVLVAHRAVKYLYSGISKESRDEIQHTHVSKDILHPPKTRQCRISASSGV